MAHKYMNGRDSKFAVSRITNSLFVGDTVRSKMITPETCASSEQNCPGPLPLPRPMLRATRPIALERLVSAHVRGTYK